MMAGKRLLDVAALFNASRGVAQKHVALRSRQLEVWSKTSTVAKAVQSQTERATETARAASFLASRMNGDRPSWTTEASHSANGESIPSRESTEGEPISSAPKEGLEQDHFYDRSKSNTSSDPVPTGDLEVVQETPDRYPLPDGTIPPSKSSLNVPQRDEDSTTERKPSTPKHPLADERRENGGLRPASSGTSAIPDPSNTEGLLPDRAKRLQRQFEQQIPSQVADAEEERSNNDLSKGHDEDIFYAPSKHTSPVLSSLPRVKIPKKTENTQSNDEHVQYGGINSDSYSAPSTDEISISAAQAVVEQEHAPEGINTDLFYSPRVARMLGGRTQTPVKGNLEMEAAEKQHPGTTSQIFGMRPKPEGSISPETLFREQAATSSEDDDVSEHAQKTMGDVSNSSNISLGLPSAASTYEMRESRVPASRINRLWNYGGLAAGMFGGAITEGLRRVTGSGGEGSYMLSEGNMDRLVAKLSRMRGAALKLGQMMSFQDSKMLPAPIQQVLLRVQDSADYMPPSQRNRVLASNLGPEWRELFSEFQEKPIAAASIGQVHSAILKSSGQRVAVKVQYPGVADSIDSDLSNLAVLLTASRLLPKGLYLEKTIANARTELAWECDYIREAECGERFQRLLSDEKDTLVVPKIYSEASGKQVLTMEYMEGQGVTKVQGFTQKQKDWIGTQILRLCLREITEFRFMQTDPNWTNFLYNAATSKLELLDFGASREYPEEFISRYTRLLLAASKSDEDAVRSLSIELGYLTGHESKAMLNAHIASVLTLAEPFLTSSPEVYDFRDQTITERVKALIPVMVRERLAPPPEETYSLHRKLSGAFLLCARLGSRVRCRELFENSMVKAGLSG